MGKASTEPTYEVHLTVHLDGQRPEALATFARARGLRFLHIVLDAGVHPNQPMLSWKQDAGVDAALNRAASVADELESVGMKLARVKVEADPDLVATLSPKYFEAHFKVEVRTEQASDLEHVARELGVHLSRGAYSRTGNTEQRFLTARQRAWDAAKSVFDRVEQVLRDGPFRLLEVQREAVLHDSNVGLDEGWSR